MAGNTKVGVAGENALKTEVYMYWFSQDRQGKRCTALTARLSQIPTAILAKSSALQGATNTISAHFLNWILRSDWLFK
jgi:hypothetical protein